jgi:hypothetical protein
VGEAVRVSVAEGTVRVSRGAETTLVSAGTAWPTSGPDASGPAAPAIAADSDRDDDGTDEALDMDPMRLERRASPASAPTPAPAPPTAPDDAARERYESALRLEGTRPDAALALYRALAAGRGPWAANALFAEARLELERGARDQATRLLRAYLERYPDGPNASLARALLRDAR